MPGCSTPVPFYVSRPVLQGHSRGFIFKYLKQIVLSNS